MNPASTRSGLFTRRVISMGDAADELSARELNHDEVRRVYKTGVCPKCGTALDAVGCFNCGWPSLDNDLQESG